MKELSLKQRVRNPYRLTYIPFWSKLYRAAYDNASVAKPHREKDPRWFLRAVARASSRIPFLQGYGQGEYNGVPFLWREANTQFHSIYFERFMQLYEPDVTAFILQNLPDDGCFWDCGSNWGHLTGVVLANRPSTTCVAFEPNSETYLDLIRFCRECALVGRVAALPYGLSDNEHLARLNLPDNFHSGLAETHDDPSGNICLVRGDSLPVSAPHVIKIDVEGAEYEALLGMSALIQAHLPYIMFESFESLSRRGGFNEIWNFLNTFGYVLYTRSDLSVESAEDDFVSVSAKLVETDTSNRRSLPDKVNVLCYPPSEHQPSISSVRPSPL